MSHSPWRGRRHVSLSRTSVTSRQVVTWSKGSSTGCCDHQAICPKIKPAYLQGCLAVGLGVGRAVRAVLAPCAGLVDSAAAAPVGAELHRDLGGPHERVVKVFDGRLGRCPALEPDETKVAELVVFRVLELDVRHLALHTPWQKREKS